MTSDIKLIAQQYIDNGWHVVLLVKGEKRAASSWQKKTYGPNDFNLGDFALAKWIKYWAVVTLGPRWSFRVLVLSGSPLITTGPYRFMRHPNYLGVIGKIGGMAVMAQAPLAGITSLLVFAALLVLRIRVEERALGRSDPIRSAITCRRVAAER